MEFSAKHRIAEISTGICRRTQASKAHNTAAAPAMSPFIPGMPTLLFNDRPPVISKIEGYFMNFPMIINFEKKARVLKITKCNDFGYFLLTLFGHDLQIHNFNNAISHSNGLFCYFLENLPFS